MFCRKCGVELSQDAIYCNKCGTQVIILSPGNDGNQTASDNSAQPPATKKVHLTWYYILIYFSLFAGAVLNAIEGISNFILLSNIDSYIQNYHSYYGYNRDISNIGFVFLMRGFLFLISAGFLIYSRFRLARFRKYAPNDYLQIMIVYYILATLLNIIEMAIIGKGSVISIFTSIFCSALYVVLNAIYFKKREFLFVN